MLPYGFLFERFEGFNEGYLKILLGSSSGFNCWISHQPTHAREERRTSIQIGCRLGSCWRLTFVSTRWRPREMSSRWNVVRFLRLYESHGISREHPDATPWGVVRPRLVDHHSTFDKPLSPTIEHPNSIRQNLNTNYIFTTLINIFMTPINIQDTY